MSVYYEPVALPIMGGVDTKTDTRNLPAMKLARLENCTFDVRGQVRKRPGYEAIPAQTIVPPENPYVPLVPGSILGYDEYDAGVSPPRRYTFSAGRWREGRGIATRDDEVLTWTGTQLLSKTGASHVGRSSAAYLPSVTSQIVAQYQTAQTIGDFASTGVVDVYAWRDSLLGPAYAVYDSVTGACLVSGTTLPGAPGTTSAIRVLSCGTRVHILLHDAGAATIVRWTVLDTAPLDAPVAVTAITGASANFDVEKISETEFVVAYILAATSVRITYFMGSGAVSTTPAPAATGSIDDAAAPASPTGVVCISVHPTTRNVLVGWSFTALGAGIACRMLTPALTPLTTIQIMHTGADVAPKITAAPNYLLQPDGGTRFDIYISFTQGAIFKTECYSLNEGGPVGGATYSRFRATIQSRAFRVGHETFVHLGRTTTFQATYHLFDGNGVFHGSVQRGLSFLPDATGSVSATWLPSVWSARGTQTRPDNLVQQWVAGCRLAQEDTGLRRFNYDFGAPLRWAQAGRATYFQGVGLREYDGEALYEAGIAHFPEGCTAGVPTAGGSLTDAGVYQWRIYAVRRNAQGERVRSAALSITPVSAPTAVNRTVLITIPTLPFTSFPGDVIFEVYRTTAGQTTFYRESSVDPASADCPKNTLGAMTVTFSSSMADTALDDREIDPFSRGILPSFFAPAGNVLAQGKDRLWIAGGELSPGTVVGSKVLEEGAGVEFVADTLSFTVDRAADDVTAMAFLGDSTVVFKEKSIYAVDGDGPSNQGAGGFPLPRLITADTGAVSPHVALIPGGVMFQSQLGLRLLTGGGSVGYVGADVEGELGTLTGAVVIPARRRVMFTQTTPKALVYDFDMGQWAVFTGHDAVGIALSADLLHVAKPSGEVWVETPGKFQDAGNAYSQVGETGDFHLETLDNVARIRRAGFVGDVVSPCKFVTEVRFNEGPWRPLGEWLTENFTGGYWAGGDFWGSDDTWGGFRGAIGNLRVRKRLPRQLCATVAFRWHDEQDLTNQLGAGISLTQIILEVGRRRGMSRLGANRS